MRGPNRLTIEKGVALAQVIRDDARAK